MTYEHKPDYVLRMIAEREQRVRDLEARLATTELMLATERNQLRVMREFHAILTNDAHDASVDTETSHDTKLKDGHGAADASGAAQHEPSAGS